MKDKAVRTKDIQKLLPDGVITKPFSFTARSMELRKKNTPKTKKATTSRSKNKFFMFFVFDWLFNDAKIILYLVFPNLF
jgi:hypothetical protein